MPIDWNVVQIGGNRQKGLLLLADLKHPRLGIRWDTPPAGTNPATAVEMALAAELGALPDSPTKGVVAPARVDAPFTSQRLFIDPSPTGRDVWVAHAPASGRLIQLTAPTTAGGRTRFRERIICTVSDTTTDGPQAWSVLDLSCLTPAGWSLQTHKLSAGDVRLSFADTDGGRLLVRQLAPAWLALSRQPLEKWLSQHPMDRSRGDHGGEVTFHYSASVCGRPLAGLKQVWSRRRSRVARLLPGRMSRSDDAPTEVHAFHSPEHDRLWFVESNAPDAAVGVVESLGWADEPAAAVDGERATVASPTEDYR